MKCQTKYFGPSYPQLHGTQCEMEHPHTGQRHVAIVNGQMVRWYTAAEKAVISNP